jgi:hypothetical protein
MQVNASLETRTILDSSCFNKLRGMFPGTAEADCFSELKWTWNEFCRGLQLSDFSLKAKLLVSQYQDIPSETSVKVHHRAY